MRRAIPAFLLLVVSGILVYHFWIPRHAQFEAMAYEMAVPQINPPKADKGKAFEIPLKPIPIPPPAQAAKPTLRETIDSWLTLAGKASPIITAGLAILQFKKRRKK
jgi:hypothetical protein